jgi:deazaflavin-dependent oxidoreductase (nitroreductase family)
MSRARKDLVFRAATVVHRTLYRRTGGRIGGRMGGAPVLLLTTTGRKTGKRRTTPLVYLPDGDRLLVVASKGGDDRAPTWDLNLKSNPNVDVEVGRDARRMRAAPASPGERPELWSKVTQMYPTYDTYQSKTRRSIPVVILSPEQPPA